MFKTSKATSILLAGIMLAANAASGHATTALESFAGKEGTISIAGGTAHIPVMKEAARLIMTKNPAIKITIAGGGSGVGVKQVGEGLVDIGNTGRPLKSSEIEQYGLRTFPFAIDGVAVAVNPANPVSDLTNEQIKAIYSGGVTNWKDVGGKDAPITLYTREDGSGTREVFATVAIKGGDILQTASIVNSNGAMKTAIAQDPNAVGYVGIGHVDKNVKALSVNGIAATQENASSGKYPVTRDLFMNVRQNVTPLTIDFVDFILTSKEGEAIIAKSGYIPILGKTAK